MTTKKRIAGKIIVMLCVLVFAAQAGCAKPQDAGRQQKTQQEQQKTVSGDNQQQAATGENAETITADTATREMELASAKTPAVKKEEKKTSGTTPVDKENETMKKSPVEQVLRLHEPAPPLELIDIDGNPVSASDFKGKPIVLSFWDVKCNLCIEQMKTLQSEMKKKNARAQLIMVSPGRKFKEKKEDPDPTEEDHRKTQLKAVEMIKKSGLDAVVAFDTEFKTISAFRARGVPFNVLIDAAGSLQAAGRLLPLQKINTMTFADMVVDVAKGGDVPTCELYDHSIPDNYKDMIGKAVPAFKAPDYNNEEQSPTFYKNFSRLLIVFWSPACPHCRAELPRLELYNREFAEADNMKIVGIISLPERENAGKYEEVAHQLINVFGISFPMVPDYGQKIQDPYNIKGVPTSFIVDRDGIVKKVFSGEFLFTAEMLHCAIEEIDAGKKDG